MSGNVLRSHAIASAIVDNTASGRGGGIYNAGTLIAEDSAISDNTANVGGGIYNVGALTVGQSTIVGNTAADGGGIMAADAAPATALKAKYGNKEARPK